MKDYSRLILYLSLAASIALWVIGILIRQESGDGYFWEGARTYGLPWIGFLLLCITVQSFSKEPEGK